MVNNFDVYELKRRVQAAILDTLQARPALTYQQVAEMYQVSRKTVCNIAKAASHRRPTGRKPRYLTEVS